ncbi:hypothetical protein [Catellatospora sp. NPDC049609]|uniref:5'-methylthioadenosine/S-adenosylhomocysteine nucleosidase family protein n=1 Tax=Catellatospora sp. NPDC049609 TaxID=3155505 RepID=UPI00341C5F80
MGGAQHNVIGNISAGAVTFGDHSPATAHGPAAAPPRGHSTVLLIVAADVERRAAVAAITTLTGTPPRPGRSRNQTWFTLGRVSATEVVIAQVGQGTETPDSAIGVMELVDAVRPDAVILLGICYGLRDEGRRPQRLGDVIVASQLILVAHRKVADTVILRGGAVHPSPVVLDRCRAALTGWDDDIPVHLGPMVSESVLVDSAGYRERLKELCPEAVGGEMEGASVYAAAIRNDVKWGVVKAICDWGHGKNDDHQEVAAANAAAFTAHLIGTGGLDPVP